MSFYFIIPDYTRFVSGGNWYNEQLIDALKLETERPIYIWTIDELRTQFSTLEKGVFFVDTLYLEAITRYLLIKKEGQQFHLIVHHLGSLFPPETYTSDTYFEEKEKRILPLFDGFLTSSQYTANYLKERQLTQKSLVLPPALSSLPKNIPLRKSLPIKAIIVANVVKRKGILPFLQAFQKQYSKEPLPHLSIAIVGGWTIEHGYGHICKTLVANNPALAQSIHFLGSQSQQAMQAIYRNSNLLISTSFFETYGMALQEAVAWKLPIIAIAGGNIANHIEVGTNGYLVENTEALVQQLWTIARQKEKLQQLLKSTYHWEGKVEQTWREKARVLSMRYEV